MSMNIDVMETKTIWTKLWYLVWEKKNLIWQNIGAIYIENHHDQPLLCCWKLGFQTNLFCK